MKRLIRMILAMPIIAMYELIVYPVREQCFLEKKGYTGTFEDYLLERIPKTADRCSAVDLDGFAIEVLKDMVA